MAGNAPSSTPGASASSHGAAMWMQGLACGALLTFETATALLLCVLMAPAIISAIAEPGPERSVTRAVALGCAAAALRPVWRLWLAGNRLEGALSILSQPVPLLLAWGAGACAWACCVVLPVVLKGAWDVSDATRVRSLEAELKHYREEWVLDPPSAGR